MASTYEQSGQHHPEPGPACDVGALDDLACESEGIKAQAEYTASKETDLKRRRTAFDTAKAEYATARTDAAAQVNELRHRLTQLREQLRCRLSRRVIECLEEAWNEVRDELRECGAVEAGCCLGDDEQCEFETGEEGSDQDLRARKAEFERRVKAAEDCFDALILEPAALTQRVADLKLEVDAITAEAADPATTDVKHTYARLLWAWQRLVDIWLGFEDVNAYNDCLCRGLACSVRGHKAIAVLVGELAVRACREQAEQARCTTLRTHVVDEILSVFLKLCPPEDGDGEYGGKGGGYGQQGEGGSGQPSEGGYERPAEGGYERPPEGGYERPPEGGYERPGRGAPQQGGPRRGETAR
jgi:hypothetical protein